MRLTERDQYILEAIHAYDGMLSFSQIQRMFFTGKSQAELRLRLLYHSGYLNRPDKDQRRRLPEMIYWLDRKGAELVASLHSATLPEIGWRKEPRWFQVEHDIAVNDFRLALEAAAKASQEVRLEAWIPESEFWSFPDKVEYSYGDRRLSRQIRPDGFFTLIAQGHRIRYLLEIDRSTEDNPRFYREKILPGLAYIHSEAYKDRFGFNAGRWMVVTTGERRLGNMLLQAKTAKTKGMFYFTTFDRVNPASILFAPIWKRADKDELVPMIFID
jgi:hypothetical protein